MRRKKYDPVRRLRIGDSTFRSLEMMKKVHGGTWDKFFVDMTKGGKIVGQSTEIVGQKIDTPGVQDVMKAFYEFNPTLNFANTTQRKAGAELIEKFGLERVLKVIDFVKQTRGMTYAPRIANPLQLRDKWTDLETFGMGLQNKINNKQVVEI